MGRDGAATPLLGRALVEDWRLWTVAYLVLALPLSLFLYLNAFQEATSFFGNSYAAWVLRSPCLSLLVVSGLGGWTVWRLPLMGRTFWAMAWLLVGATAGMVLREPALHWRQAAAVALCLPAWLSLRARWPGLWNKGPKPLGELSIWAQNGLLVVTAIILSFVGNTLWICLAFPEFHAGVMERVFLAGRVAAIAGGPAILGVPLLLGAVALVRRLRFGSGLMMLLLGLGLLGASGLILFNGLSRLDPALVRPVNFFYALALACPLSVCFCERLATGGPTLAEAVLTFGRSRSARFSLVRPGPYRCIILVLSCAGLFVGVECLIGTAHRYYEWGFGTSLFYSALSIAWTWALLTILPRRGQFWVGGGTLTFALLGCLSFLPLFRMPALWALYTKFDNNLGSLERAYYRRHPRPEPVFLAGRRLLDGSFELAPTNLMVLRRQGLLSEHPVQQPFVFFIVCDALRTATYGPGPLEHRQRFPGIAWMAQRFVLYTNAWSSYNATFGSYPAYLNGALNPVWYQFTTDWPIQHDNLVARAAGLAGYCCYNLATFDTELARLWPTNTAIELGTGGQGVGDPAVEFPQALATLDRHRRQQPSRPALFYLHLYNLHQPLLKRPGVALDKGEHWMRALYEANAVYFDSHLKAFLQGLEQRHILQQALVLVTGDHGEEVFDLGGLYHGWQLNPLVMTVPLYVHYPAGTAGAPPPGTFSARPVNLIDLAPTICQLMGISILRDSPWQGVSLLEPEPTPPRSFLLLSWETPLVGRVSFSPMRMLVLNFESGQEEAFVPGHGGWLMSPPPVPATALAHSLLQDLRGMFHYWRMDPEKQQYLLSK